MNFSVIFWSHSPYWSPKFFCLQTIDSFAFSIGNPYQHDKASQLVHCVSQYMNARGVKKKQTYSSTQDSSFRLHHCFYFLCHHPCYRREKQRKWTGREMHVLIAALISVWHHIFLSMFNKNGQFCCSDLKSSFVEPHDKFSTQWLIIITTEWVSQ